MTRMKGFLRFSCLALLLVGLGAAQVYGTVGVPGPSGGLINQFKTHPMVDSEHILVPIVLHNPNTIPNFAGFRLKVHVLDGTEVSLDPNSTLGPAGTSNPSFVPPTHPQSTPGQSIPVFGTVWDPAAINSGFDLPGSQQLPVAVLDLHAKRTTPLNNSDIDLTVMVWNIHHVNQGPGSTHITLKESDYMYGAPNFNPVTLSEFPTDPPAPGQGTWYHVGPTVGGVKTVHLPGGIGSAFYATLAGTVGIGIEHVPEPATGLVLISGVGTLLFGLRARNRRVS